MTFDTQTKQIDSTAGRIRLLLGLVIVLLCVCWALAIRNDLLADPDVWWHMRTGRWIWENKAFPTADAFSYTYIGQPWIAKEWLSQVIFFRIFAWAGWNGLAVLAAITVGLAAALLYGSVSRSLKPALAASAVLVALFLMDFTIKVRPHMLTLPLLVIWTHALFTASREGRSPSYLLLGVLLLWANLHAAFTMGFVIAFFAFLDFLETTKLKKRKELMHWLAFLALCPLVTLIHPYTYQAMLATLAVFRPNEGVLTIFEWQPFNAQNSVQHVAVLMLLLFAALTSGFRLGFARSLLIVLLIYLFLTHVRYAFFLFPVLLILVPPAVASQFPSLSFEQWRSRPLEPIEQRLGAAFRPAAAAIGAVLAALLGAQLWVLSTTPPQEVAASDAIAFVQSHALTGNVFNHYNFGGPLIFQGIPTFIDGRTDQLFRDKFGKDYEDSRKDEQVFAATLRKYDVQWTILPPRDPRVKMLEKMPGWKKVFSDDYAVVQQREENTPPEQTN